MHNAEIREINKIKGEMSVNQQDVRPADAALGRN